MTVIELGVFSVLVGAVVVISRSIAGVLGANPWLVGIAVVAAEVALYFLLRKWVHGGLIPIADVLAAVVLLAAPWVARSVAVSPWLVASALTPPALVLLLRIHNAAALPCNKGKCGSNEYKEVYDGEKLTKRTSFYECRCGTRYRECGDKLEVRDESGSFRPYKKKGFLGRWVDDASTTDSR